MESKLTSVKARPVCINTQHILLEEPLGVSQTHTHTYRQTHTPCIHTQTHTQRHMHTPHTPPHTHTLKATILFQ